MFTGLLWIPNCAQVITSRSSSKVPYPPINVAQAKNSVIPCCMGVAMYNNIGLLQVVQFIRTNRVMQ